MCLIVYDSGFVVFLEIHLPLRFRLGVLDCLKLLCKKNKNSLLILNFLPDTIHWKGYCKTKKLQHHLIIGETFDFCVDGVTTIPV